MSNHLIKQAIEKGVRQIIEESNVPFAVHKKSIEKLKETIDGFNTRIKELESELSENQKSRKEHEKQIAYFNKQIEGYQRQIDRLSQINRGEKGEPGEKGNDGMTPDLTEVARKVISMIRLPKDGKDGKDGIGKDGKDAKIDEDKLVEKIVDLFKKKQLLNVDSIKGLREYVKSSSTGAVKNSFTKDGTKYLLEELMHGGGSSNGGSITYAYDLSSQCDGVNTVFTVPANTNFLQLSGTDAPFIYRPTTDYLGSGTTTLTLTGAVTPPSLGATLILLYVP